ncbi:MAG: diadenosine tetraphosphate hydrolase, partial [Candidatus Berkelbacteria bacterium]|nr:diadenosine tetraphosphate hydrolase [Candidatus Berkelbacteria bacterium]
AKGVENELTYTKQQDVFYRDKDVTAFIASHWWPSNNAHVLIIPNQHIENIYDLSDELSGKIHSFERKVAIAIKEIYHCDGVSSRQHNEPAGNQDVWHYHLHVFPRYNDDNLYLVHNKKKLSNPTDRMAFADKLKDYFSK